MRRSLFHTKKRLTLNLNTIQKKTFEDALHNQTKKVDFGVQCFLEDFEPQPLSYQESNESETKNFNDF